MKTHQRTTDGVKVQCYQFTSIELIKSMLAYVHACGGTPPDGDVTLIDNEDEPRTFSIDIAGVEL